MRRVAAALAIVLALMVVAGLLDGIVWPGPAAALFRPQLTLFVLAAALVAIIAGARAAALAALAAGALGVGLLVPALRDPGPAAPAAGQEAIELLTLNLWGRNDDVARVAGLIARERPDVVALLELTPAWARALAPALRRYEVRAVEPSEGASGIGLFGREHLRDPGVVRVVEGARPAVEARLALPGGGVARLLVVHPTSTLLPGDRVAHERELAAIAAWARDRGPRSAVCGDINAAPWTRSMRDLLSDGRLRAALPGGFFGGSWPALPRPLRVAVDGCLVGAGLGARAELGPRVGSDHLPVVVELAGSPGVRR